jgi:hypothetical protein
MPDSTSREILWCLSTTDILTNFYKFIAIVLSKFKPSVFSDFSTDVV